MRKKKFEKDAKKNNTPRRRIHGTELTVKSNGSSKIFIAVFPEKTGDQYSRTYMMKDFLHSIFMLFIKHPKLYEYLLIMFSRLFEVI